MAAATLDVDEPEFDATELLDLTIETTHAATITLVSRYGTTVVSVDAGTHGPTTRICRAGN